MRLALHGAACLDPPTAGTTSTLGLGLKTRRHEDKEPTQGLFGLHRRRLQFWLQSCHGPRATVGSMPHLHRGAVEGARLGILPRPAESQSDGSLLLVRVGDEVPSTYPELPD